MSQLGSRLFFLIIDATAETTEAELIAGLNQPVPYKETLDECTKIVHEFLSSLFTEYKGIRGVEWDASHNSGAVIKNIAQCARLLAVLRTPYDPNGTVQPESPRRANAVLYNLARGHALISGRTRIEADDLPLLARVTLASIPEKRRSTLVALLSAENASLTVAQVEAATGVTQHSAEGIMKEFQWLGMATFSQLGQGRKAALTLRPEWAWVRGKEVANLLLIGNLAENRGCVSVT